MGKGTSIQRPDLTVFRNRRLQVRFNITDATMDDGIGGTMAQFKYDYIEVSTPVDRKKIIVALIRSIFDVDDEFALMHLDPQDPAYIEYRDFVDRCKAIADEVMSVL